MINNDQKHYINSINRLNEERLCCFQKDHMKFGEACQRTFDFCCNKEEEEELCISFQQEEPCILQIYEEEEIHEEYSCEEEEECIDKIDSMDEFQNYLDRANELISSLPTFDKIKFHVENLLSLLPSDDIEKDLADLLEPLRIKLDIKIETIKNINMIGCVKSKYEKSIKVLRSEIARLNKSNQDLKKSY